MRVFYKVFNPAIYLSLAFLFGIAAHFRAINGYSFLRRLLYALKRRVGLLFAVILVTSVFSPFILNDVLILILTPVLVEHSKSTGDDIAPLLVAEVSFTNISSSLTPFGNPQNILLWESSGISALEFVKIAWTPLFVSGVLTAIALLPFRSTKQFDTKSEEASFYPAIYLFLVGFIVFSSDLAKIPSYIALAFCFFVGFAFSLRRLSSFVKEFDLKSLLTLYAFILSVSVASIFLKSLLEPYVQPVASLKQPYSALFVLGVSNVISNVPATQLILSVSSVKPRNAPLLAVEAGLAGNFDPIASLANLLALTIVKKGGLGVKRSILLQLLIGTISYIPALVLNYFAFFSAL
ncbi:hypothetical protein B9P99_02915 [Candidatus Marsarchaeota G1 archaeon OSP_B]|jgi:Na+/H+ antiporter NhaD/arsenite permease-like protein|uniref:Citrate transporter-like domain-containing protein n=5 Tax=Candidatus Marsarchaeota TaxID=1978152 RepID=A0A2R6AFQ7_9ARCH|nr:MAG: hypothetical protein B9Q01_05010 [Candidatus Marsarchaeota G1 archaeon OSP_D]PSN85169.1 MAG: hypothetical protein B9Q02_07350 [Candidatus Marsarchaeota G1 archaeon BE_D]PSN88700.1 MAG: hypothetical protein B9Q00_04535 [Candidatus Marsarchaeota G1 archaeon OSP_C]PSN92994.1 MAG: hypothetical protein B9P99_02915 [Candidatus Marsarchaeota G1 archaeon OSP_B]